MENHSESERIIRSHVVWAMGAGLIPVPLLDIAAVTSIQLDMLKQLATLHGVEYSQSSGKAFVSALTGSTFAAIGTSMLKAIPVIGSIFGGVSMSVLSGASTYAVGQVVLANMAATGSFFDVDLEAAKQTYQETFEKGKVYASTVQAEEKDAAAIYEKLSRLAKLKEEGVITEEDFEAKKQELLSKL